MKNVILLFVGLMSFSAFAAGPSATCKDIQKAEGSIVSLAYYGADASEARKFCYFLSRAVASSDGGAIGLDGLTMGSIAYCAEAVNETDLKLLAKELSEAIEAIPGCFSEIE